MKNFNSLIVPKNLKEGKLWFCCKISKNLKGGPFGDIKKFSKKSLTKPKRVGGPYRKCKYRRTIVQKTSRDRPKSAPYPRLKNSKTTSKCQVLFYSTRKSKFFEKKISKKLHTQKKWTEWRAKVSQCRKTEREDLLRFFNIHSVAKHEKIE